MEKFVNDMISQRIVYSVQSREADDYVDYDKNRIYHYNMSHIQGNKFNMGSVRSKDTDAYLCMESEKNKDINFVDLTEQVNLTDIIRILYSADKFEKDEPKFALANVSCSDKIAMETHIFETDKPDAMATPEEIKNICDKLSDEIQTLPYDTQAHIFTAMEREIKSIPAIREDAHSLTMVDRAIFKCVDYAWKRHDNTLDNKNVPNGYYSYAYNEEKPPYSTVYCMETSKSFQKGTTYKMKSAGPLSGCQFLYDNDGTYLGRFDNSLCFKMFADITNELKLEDVIKMGYVNGIIESKYNEKTMKYHFYSIADEYMFETEAPAEKLHLNSEVSYRLHELTLELQQDVEPDIRAKIYSNLHSNTPVLSAKILPLKDTLFLGKEDKDGYRTMGLIDRAWKEYDEKQKERDDGER